MIKGMYIKKSYTILVAKRFDENISMNLSCPVRIDGLAIVHVTK